MCEMLQSSVKMLPLAFICDLYELKSDFTSALKLDEKLLVEPFPSGGSNPHMRLFTLYFHFNGALHQFFFCYQCLDQFKPVLKKLWFEKYAKRGQYPTSSGFEHTFVGKYSHDVQFTLTDGGKEV